MSHCHRDHDRDHDRDRDRARMMTILAHINQDEWFLRIDLARPSVQLFLVILRTNNTTYMPHQKHIHLSLVNLTVS